MDTAHALIIGGGATGGALAHDLMLRGLHVTLVERGELTSGTTGRHHGLLHSGGRYAVQDREAGQQCIEENMILRRIMPGSFEQNGGLFVAVTDEEAAYCDTFLEACADCGIPATRLTGRQARLREPNLSPAAILAVEVPDASMDAMRMALRFFATALHHGADIRAFTEVVGISVTGGAVSGVRLRDHRRNREYDLQADIVVNAAGAWSGHVAALAGADVPVRPSPGVMLALGTRLTNMIVNRLAPPSDGDIIVPQRGLSVVGTTSWLVDDPDDLGLPEDHIQRMFAEGARLVPLVGSAPFRAAWAGARPLVGSRTATDSREMSRTFKCFDHTDEGIQQFVTITGGKATTARAMAEATADLVCRKLGIQAACRTRDVVCLPYSAYYALSHAA